MASVLGGREGQQQHCQEQGAYKPSRGDVLASGRLAASSVGLPAAVNSSVWSPLSGFNGKWEVDSNRFSKRFAAAGRPIEGLRASRTLPGASTTLQVGFVH